jgi:hypothetical protein
MEKFCIDFVELDYGDNTVFRSVGPVTFDGGYVYPAAEVDAEIERLRADIKRLKYCIDMHQEDCAVLPEDRSVTETVNALRADLAKHKAVVEVAIAASNAYWKLSSWSDLYTPEMIKLHAALSALVPDDTQDRQEDNMTPGEAFNKLKELQENGDTEMAHPEADNILCDLLQTLGYDDIVSEYMKVDKWYA